MSGVEHELEADAQGLKRTLKDLFAGAVGGTAQVLLGMFVVISFLVLSSQSCLSCPFSLLVYFLLHIIQCLYFLFPTSLSDMPISVRIQRYLKQPETNAGQVNHSVCSCLRKCSGRSVRN
jgi:hypothetical protein